jgi:type I restriction enzyme, S subunit
VSAASLTRLLGGTRRGWVTVRLKATVTSCSNGVWGDEPNGVDDVVCVRVADFDRLRRRVRLIEPTQRAVALSQRKGRLLAAGDLLLEKSGGGDQQPVGTVVLYDHPERAVCSNFVARMSVSPAYDSRFLCYLHHALYSVAINTRSIKQTTGIQNLDSDAYLNERVDVPAIDEQRAIADFLDTKTAAIDALVAKKARLIELLEEKRQALITQAVTKGLTPQAAMKDSGDRWLRMIPAHWQLKRVMHLTRFDRPVMYGIVLPGPNVDQGVPIVKGGDVDPDRLRLGTLSRTTTEIDAAHSRSRLRHGDVLVSIRGSIGMVALVPSELEGANLTQDAARVSPADGIDSEWLVLALTAHPVFSQLEAGSLGATVRGINIRDLKRAKVPVPPPAEQARLADAVHGQLEKLQRTRRSTETGVALLSEYRQALISAAVTGQIDVRAERAEVSV